MSDQVFGINIDAMLIKLYRNDREKEARYSPAECIGCRVVGITGDPEAEHVSTKF